MQHGLLQISASVYFAADTYSGRIIFVQFLQNKRQRYLYLHLCVFIYIFGFVFRIYNRLIFIQSIISGSRIADRNGDQIEGHSFKAKHFKGNQNRSNRAVRHTTENSSHSAGCAKGGRKPYQLSCHASESGAYAERRNDFASAKPAFIVSAVRSIFQKKAI